MRRWLSSTGGKTGWLPLGLFLIAATLAFWPLFLGRFYAIGDMRDVFIPLESFFQQELRAGRLPVWHPDVAWGFPVMASAQIGFFYPPLLLARWLLPLWLYLPAMLVGHVIAAMGGSYLFLRQTTTRNAALFGSLSFGLSAFFWQHLTHLNIFLVMAWLPWQLWIVDRVCRRSAWRGRDYALVAGTLAIPFLIGQLQLPFLQAVVALTYVFFRRQRQSLKRNVGSVVVVGLLLSLIAAAQIIPSLELLLFSSRGSGGDFDVIRANQHSFPLYHLPTLLWPRFYGSDFTYWGKRLEIEYGIFIGTLPLLLAGWFLLKMRRAKIDRTVHFWLLLGLVSFLLALGSISPFRLLGLEPSLWFFSAPARWLLFTTWALCVLAAYGFDAARKNLREFTRYLKIVGVCLLVVFGLGNILLWLLPSLLPRLATVWPHLFHASVIEKLASLLESASSSSLSWRSFYSFLPLVVVGTCLVAIRRRFWLLTAVSAIELLLIAATTTPAIPWQRILTPPATVTALPTAVLQKQARLISFQPPGGDTGAWFTNPTSRPDQNRRELQRQLLLPLISAQHNVPGVAWPASLDLQEQAIVLEDIQTDPASLVNAAEAIKRNIGAVLAPRGTVVVGAETQITHGGVTIATLTPFPRAELIDQQTSQRFPVSYQAVTPTRTLITAQSPCNCEVIVRDTWYPGWVARRNGERAVVEPAETIFRKIAVGKGSQEIELVYRPYSVYLGLTLSLVGAGSCLILILRRGRVQV